MFAVNIEDNDQLSDEITTLAGQINAANYRFLKLVSEFDKREAWSGFGIRSCTHWLNWQCGIALNAAREKVRVARALDGLPEINEAFEKGELSFSKVRAMTRIATPLNESYLLMIANHGRCVGGDCRALFGNGSGGAVNLRASERCQLIMHVHSGAEA